MSKCKSVILLELIIFKFFIKLGSEAHDEIKYRRQVRDTVESVINSSIYYSLQNLRNYYYDIDLEQLIYCSNRKFCHLHYRWDDVKAMRQRRREAGLDVENYTIQDVMRMSRRSASDSPIDDDMSPYPINEN
ncbi:hypothetical protein GCK72_019773 [Caenorhabditis remanei]|uniref:Uncharacterized protein n=1 Tax=Caenorhabditis remanei TaxID=31234 RepID=A0A6A5G8Q0_CAERE|nr:hypothetical protein GCK72_017625 [Caenorhabditis remanei]XP_053582130.1 hypothetical protein GCK72_019773 [Caenorhabditis remanei]KAF1751073.1 hypothetical protein GCK72_017625 [Caenorhabditis remanei]KAF1753217.1 hypothetical protein GCK72_019773 [Caenorhabditis remanei]